MAAGDRVSELTYNLSTPPHHAGRRLLQWEGMDDNEAPQLLKEMHEHLDVRAWFDVFIDCEWEAVGHSRADPCGQPARSRLTRSIHHNFYDPQI